MLRGRDIGAPLAIVGLAPWTDLKIIQRSKCCGMGSVSKSAPCGHPIGQLLKPQSIGPAHSRFTVAFSRSERSSPRSRASYFVDIDFKKHVALVAVVDEGTGRNRLLAVAAMCLSRAIRPRSPS